MGLGADIILPAARLTRAYAEAVLKDVKPDQFARFARSNGEPVKSNHPAFVFGHLSVYPTRICAMLNKPGPANPPGFEDLFNVGKECVDDPKGTIYPPMDAILKHFNAGHDAAMEAVAAAADSEWPKVNPNEKGRERFPTVGAVTCFLLTGHAMSHLGQVSGWRRFMGLGSAF